MLMAAMTATLLTTRWRAKLSPMHHGTCRFISRHTGQVEGSLVLMDFTPQHAHLSRSQNSKLDLSSKAGKW